MQSEFWGGMPGKPNSDPYAINYDDKRFANVETAKTQALNEVDKNYGEMIDKSDSFYEEQIQASKDWEEQQKQLQQEQTDFAIDQIEQQKEQAEKDYTKEQSGAYADWQKQSNQYGANAEQMASQGMSNTGFSESSQVAMYTAYQSRVSAAREAFTRATLDYDNAIKDAILQNNSVMAQLAFESYQKRLELALAGFQYKNQLILDQSDKKLQVESLYYQRWQDVLAQMNAENSLAEQIRQFNESIALEQAQLAEQQRQFNFQNKLGEFANTGGGSSGVGSGTISYNTLLANLSNRDRKAYEEEQKNAQLTGNTAPVRSDIEKHGGVVMTPWGTK